MNRFLSATDGSNPKRSRVTNNAPLADRVRPTTIDAVVGHSQLLSRESPFLRAVMGPSDHLNASMCSSSQNANIPSFILWGPSGCGKTSLVRAIAKQHAQTHRLVELSAISLTIAELKKVWESAIQGSKMGMKTLLFVDEIHRLNKAQQDAFLPYVEKGVVVLLGATTENPSFECNAALLSRCRVFCLEKLSVEDVQLILRNALAQEEKGLGKVSVCFQDNALELIATTADGDARAALNTLELVCSSAQLDEFGSKIVDSHQVEVILNRKGSMHYDKNGEQHYNIISAFHKSIRGSDADAALYWLGRMLEGGEDPKYVARRMIRIASEDIGLGDPQALPQAVAAFLAVERLGMPECDVCLAQCAVYLAQAKKSVQVYKAYKRVKETIAKKPNDPVPLHIRNASTSLVKNLGYGQEYKYNPDFNYCSGKELGQSYLPDSVQKERFLVENE